MAYINPLSNPNNVDFVSTKVINNKVLIEDQKLFAKEIAKADEASNKNGTKIAENDITSANKLVQSLQTEIMKILFQQMLTKHIENNAQGPSNGIYDVLAATIADTIV